MKKLKNTESAQLWSQYKQKRTIVYHSLIFTPARIEPLNTNSNCKEFSQHQFIHGQ